MLQFTVLLRNHAISLIPHLSFSGSLAFLASLYKGVSLFFF